jgi:hypothetical protein
MTIRALFPDALDSSEKVVGHQCTHRDLRYFRRIS